MSGGGYFRSAAVALAAVVLGLNSAFADLTDALPEFASSQRWSIFTLGASTTNGDELHGGVLVAGDVGVAGGGDIVLTDDTSIQGNLYSRSGGTVQMAPGAVIT